MTERPLATQGRAIRAALMGLSLLCSPALAQEGSPFSPRLTINGDVISNYEMEQRMLFLQVLRIPGDLEKEALDGLTNDRLGEQAARALDITLTDAQVQAGMAEFAGRANLGVEDFIKAIGDEGVAAETFRDFVSSGILWREVVRARFGSQVKISDVQVERALAERARKPEVKVLLSELVLAVGDREVADVVTEARAIKASIDAGTDFTAAASENSDSPTAERGGALDWMPLSNLPPAISGQVLTLAPGDVSDPIVVPDAVVLFQMNALEDSETPAPAQVEVEYARLFLPTGEDPAQVRANVDDCGDLYPLVRGLPEDRLIVTKAMMSELPGDIGLDLARLDRGETVQRARDGGTEVLMLCLRKGILPPPEETPEAKAAAEAKAKAEADAAAAAGEAPAPEKTPEKIEAAERETVRNQLGNQQLAALADAYMEELRSEAIIKTP